ESALNDVQANVKRARAVLVQSPVKYFRLRHGQAPLLETYHCLLLYDDSGVYVGGIVFPRDPSRWERSLGAYWSENQTDFFPMSQLPALLQKHRHHMLAL